MDLDTRLRLRSFQKPTLRPLLKFVFATAIIQGCLLLYIKSTGAPSAVELPSWVNIKLVAGFEENKKPAKQTKQQKKTGYRQKINKVIRKKPLLKKINEKEENYKQVKTSSASATTNIKATSRPYAYENPKPVYPSAARRRGMQGVVMLSVVVNEKGEVNSVDVLESSGFRILDIAAINSVKKWHFIPATESGMKVLSTVKVPVRFSLQDTEN